MRKRRTSSRASAAPPKDHLAPKAGGEDPTSPRILGLALLLTVFLQVYLWPHVTDDAYISFRYAYNLAVGNGLVFNPGEHVEGFSNPLWTLLLAGFFAALGFPLPDIARSLGLLSALGTLIVLWQVVRKHFPMDPSTSTTLVLGFVVLSPGFHVYATAGLEGPLLGFLLTLGVALSLQEDSRSRLSAALLFGLAGITRPEGPLYAGLWFLSTLRPSPSLRETLRGEFARAAVLLLPILSWQVFRLANYGAWLPNTALAKTSGVFDEFTGLAGYLTPWLVALGGPLAILLWAVVRSRNETLLKLERMMVALVGANLVFVIYAQGDWMSFGRFIAPIWPVIGLVFGLWLSEATRRIETFADLRFRTSLPALPLAAIALCSVLAWRPSVQEYLENRGITMLMRGTDQLAVGKWISENVDSTAAIATTRIGGIGFEARKNVVWDWLGLTDAEEARHLRAGRPGTLADDPIVRRRPDVVAAVDAPADWGYNRHREIIEFLRRDYTFVLSFPQGRYGSLDIWLRNESLDRIFLTKSRYVLQKPQVL